MADPKELPNVVDVVKEVLNDLQANLAGYLLFGLPLLFVTLALVTVVTVLPLAAMAPGMLLDNELLATGGLIAGSFVAVFGSMAVTAPLSAGMYRAMWAYLVDNEPLGLGSAVSRMFEDLGSVFVFMAVNLVVSLLGLALCYVGVFIPMFVLSLAFPALIVHRLGPIGSMSLSVKHVRENAAWHVGFWGIGFAILMIGAYVPILGTPVYIAYQLRMYRKLFGDGPEPRLSGETSGMLPG